MNNHCKCIACNLTEYYKTKRENYSYTVDNTAKLKDNQLFLSDNSKKSRNYRITLSDSGTNDGYFLNFNKEITIFDFANLLSDHFGIDIDIDYEEECDSTTISDSPIFHSLEEFIDSLQDDHLGDF